MAFKKITVEAPEDAVTEVYVEDSVSLRVPGGTKLVSLLQVGDRIYVGANWSYAVEITLIEDVE